MSCDLGRLMIAISAATEGADELARFHMGLHGIRPRNELPPSKSAAEQCARAKDAFAALGTRKIARDSQE